MEQEVIHNLAMEHFKKFYIEEGEYGQLLCPNRFLILCEGDIQFIHLPFTMRELRCVVFNMGPLKSPGPNGLNPLFF